jgi:hypothetical protein
MRIESANINASASHTAIQKHVKKESQEFWIGDRRPGASGQGADSVSLTHQAAAGQPVQKVASSEEMEQSLSPQDRLLIDILRPMYKALTGEDMEIFSPGDLADKFTAMRLQSGGEKATPVERARAAAVPVSGYGLAYDLYESRYEYESVSFNAEGTIKTSDGQEIQFSVQLNMSREFYQENQTSLRLGDAAPRSIDPLVVNFDGNAAELSDTKFQFDLDSDGRTDQISLLKPGSGLLALDKNQDGTINNGTELFGTKSGDGFAELAAYDQDQNGFIDEGDDVYNKLRIWTPDSQGQQHLMALGAKGIGAIYLGHLATPFTYKDGNNATQGDVASTGLFIRENGSAGTVQQIDYMA